MVVSHRHDDGAAQPYVGDFTCIDTHIAVAVGHDTVGCEGVLIAVQAVDVLLRCIGRAHVDFALDQGIEQEVRIDDRVLQILDLRVLDRAADNAVDRIKIRVAFVIDAVVAEELVGNRVVSVPLAAFGARHVRPRADGNADDLRTAQNIVHKVGAVINNAEVDVFTVLFKGLEEIVGSIIMLRRDGEGEVPDRFRVDLIDEDMQNIVLLAEFVGFPVDVGKGSHFGGGNAADAADMIIACGFLNDLRAFVCQKFGKQRVRAAAADHRAGEILVGIKFFEINIVVCDRFFAQIRRADIFIINHLNGALAFCIVAAFPFRHCRSFSANAHLRNSRCPL